MSVITSRFRPNHDTTVDHPRAVGMCRYCMREMWTDVGEATGYVRASVDRGACQTCVTWIAKHPGLDPRDARGVAERIPAERAESDPDWRDDARCAGVPSEMFAPELDTDDPEYLAQTDADRADVWELRRHVATAVCGPCPVRDRCRATALAQGYEGVWGGVMFLRWRWVDLVTGDRGETIHMAAGGAPRSERKGHAA